MEGHFCLHVINAVSLCMSSVVRDNIQNEIMLPYAKFDTDLFNIVKITWHGACLVVHLVYQPYIVTWFIEVSCC